MFNLNKESLKKATWLESLSEERLISLDVYRGFVMLFLIAETTGLYALMVSTGLRGTLLYSLGQQFHHHQWHGLTLWDMGQSFFMFISGVAMAFSYGKRLEQGLSWHKCFKQAALRALVLFLLGWAIYIVNPLEGAPGWAFLLDVLPALAFSSLVTFLIIRWPGRCQLGFSLGLLFLTELLYRFWPVPGFNQPFAKGHNFGAHLDLKLWGETNPEGWVTFNIVPASAFLIWGLLAGNMLRSNLATYDKLRILIISGIIGLGLGLALDPITPIIKKISTSSFMLASLGFSLLFLALAIWVIDILKFRRPFVFPLAVGMNPLFIYLFARSGGADWLSRMVQPFSEALLGWAGLLWVATGTGLGCFAPIITLGLISFRKG